MTMKYKNGMRIELDSGSVIRINRQNYKYRIAGYDRDLNLLPIKTYKTLDGVKKYMLKTYGIVLE